MNAGGLRRRVVAALLVVATVSSHAAVALVASAQTDEERAAARAAATEGAKAFDEKRWADAVELFLKAESLWHAPPHLLYLARSYEKLGKLVKAQETYSKLTHETIAADKPKVFHDAKESAIKELAALEPRVPTLKTVVEGAPAGKPVKVVIDGAEMNAALLGLNRPVDPGDHSLQATSDGYASEVVTVAVKEGAHEIATLTMKASATAVATGTGTANGTGIEPATGSGTSTAAGAGMGDGDATPGAAHGGSSGKWIGIGLIGVGVVGLGLGTVFMLKSSSKSKDADDACGGPPPCPLSTKDQVSALDDQSKSAKTLGLVSLTLGGLAVAGGVIVLLTSGSSPSTTTATAMKPKPSVVPWVGVGSVGLSGSF